MDFPALQLGDGWGPSSGADIPMGALYQPFSKTERLGRAADFSTANPRNRRRRPETGEAAAEQTFNFVDNTQIKVYGRRPQRNKQQLRKKLADAEATQALQRNRNLDRDRQRLVMRYHKKWKDVYNRQADHKTYKSISSTFKISPAWPIIKDVPFAQLTKPVPFDAPKPTDVYKAGSAPYLDRKLETTRPKKPVPLSIPKHRAPVYTPTAADDPILKEHAEKGTADVFTTDDVLAYLMSASRSTYPFEIMASKSGDAIFLDKREGGPIDMSSVDENATRPPMDTDPKKINHPNRLNREATALNRFYKYQTLQGPKTMKPASMGNPDPIKVPGPPNGYRYRVWTLPNGLKVMARCQHDAICVENPPNGKQTKHFVAIRTLLEYSPDMHRNGWRRALETRKGSVLVSAMKDNSCLFSRWILSALLSGNKEIKVGFLSRRDPKVPTSHVILHVETLNTAQAAKEMDIHLNTGFGVLMGFIHYLQQEEDDEDDLYIIARAQKSVQLLRVTEDDEEDFDEEEEVEEEGVLEDGI